MQQDLSVIASKKEASDILRSGKATKSILFNYPLVLILFENILWVYNLKILDNCVILDCI